MNRDGISEGLAAIPSGVFVVAARNDGNVTAMLASFLQQSGFDPPTVVIAVNGTRPLLNAIRKSRQFAISTMSGASKRSLRRFWHGVPEGADPFEGLEIETRDTGIPILKDSIAFLECELQETLNAGDHVLCLGRVLNGGRIQAGEPLVRIRKDGFEY